MKCPNCGTADYIEGIFGPSCINASCRNHHGGYATIPEAPPPLSRVDLKKLVHLLDKMDPRGGA